MTARIHSLIFTFRMSFPNEQITRDRAYLLIHFFIFQRNFRMSKCARSRVICYIGNMRNKKFGKLQQKILVLLLTGVGLAFCHTPRQSWKVIRSVSREWDRINRQSLYRSTQTLCQAKLVTEKRLADGSITLTLTPAGRRQAAFFQLRTMSIKKPKRWDGKWRIVLFDIPEKQKYLRDIFRRHLQKIGFKELQKSVFVFPYDCEKEMMSLIKLYDAEEYFRFILATDISNASQLKKSFSVS